MKLGKRRSGTRSRAVHRLSEKLGKVRRRRPEQRVAFAWYREEDWPRLRELASDPQAIEDRHHQWRAAAEKTIALLHARGVLVEKVILDVEAAAASGQQGRPFDSAARAAFVAEVASGAVSPRTP